MSLYPTLEDDLILATLSNHLNLNQDRLDFLLECYPNITKAAEDQFQAVFSYVKRYNQDSNNNILESIEFESDNDINLAKQKNVHKWLSKVKSFQWGEINNLKDRLRSDLESNQISILTYHNFPEHILNLNDHPLILYFQGNPEVLKNTKSISIVGSRNINHYSIKVLNEILSKLDSLNICVVSGLALGVDTLAHQLALKHNLKCLAFIGSGHDKEVFYPSSNLNLKNEIINQNGLICSEYPPGFKSLPYTFPRRNRFVACVSDLTWVVQASHKSGALITAKLALDYGKIVATTPASIFDLDFDGNLSLIRDGSQVIASSEDLLSLLNLMQHNIKSQTQISEIDWDSFSNNAKKIHDNLSYEPKEIQELFIATKIPIAQLGTELSLLELNGLVLNLGMGKWVRN